MIVIIILYMYYVNKRIQDLKPFIGSSILLLKMFFNLQNHFRLAYLKLYLLKNQISIVYAKLYIPSTLNNDYHGWNHGLLYSLFKFFALQMFCLLKLQTNVCKPSPQTTSSGFHRFNLQPNYFVSMLFLQTSVCWCRCPLYYFSYFC